MKTNKVHHIVTIILALPVLVIAAWAAVKAPSLLNPWNKDMFSHMWVFVLPSLLSALGIIINEGLAILSSRQADA
jgi:hypothetical protein